MRHRFSFCKDNHFAPKNKKILFLFVSLRAYLYLCADFGRIGPVCKWEKEKILSLTVGACNW